VQTFVVRVWTPSSREGEPAPPEGLRGVVERVGLDLQMPFRSPDELLEILRSAMESEAAKSGFNPT